MVVARTPRVQFFAHLAEAVGEGLLDKHMYVFGVGNAQFAVFDIVKNIRKRGANGLRLARLDNTAFAQHGGVRDTAHDIVFI